MIEVGYCQCGCGQKTTLAPFTSRSRRMEKGKPQRFLRGHNRRLLTPAYLEEDHGYTTPCWIWQRAKQPEGYGTMWDGHRIVRAHRFYYEKYMGLIPSGHHIDHLCHEPSCINPNHLEAVHPRINAQRGRATKLSNGQVRELVTRYFQGEPIVQLTHEFNIARPMAYAMIRGAEAFKS